MLSQSCLQRAKRCTQLADKNSEATECRGDEKAPIEWQDGDFYTAYFEPVPCHSWRQMLEEIGDRGKTFSNDWFLTSKSRQNSSEGDIRLPWASEASWDELNSLWPLRSTLFNNCLDEKLGKLRLVYLEYQKRAETSSSHSGPFRFDPL